MSYGDERKLKDVIKELVSAYRLTDKLNEIDIRKYWINTMGENIASHTTGLRINERKLFITVDSPALRSELMMARTMLIKDINKNAGSSLIDEIVIL